ncbi:MAG: UTP--glucose-1-phosphate uridylyltransferase [Candidatus Magasanikbacteria bacterium]|jgi:UTP--glucose-1-phosphate uridylyltransferase|nr:UTP--glucose-1-phosphate uridylyltransferase [Candidatus Magasanikbacteria bacterium]MBT4220892.1 UTP--glucose-1-phosphate uridylyltransferase [Candidatus Magasanikbacteria bacterium]MBT4350199.1 UTP--glucose-1-phosphate uridylyltransferase [Candidatus Magasanikbacteria bacterium]MBT4541802.1 UTP--glucose-1-phosphate uridylyltransferase [Candidatus Magasanikbacteria bacterium]MBT6252824.1 UTP--glucose-1-phosphate uridylyltransferase [Candidatus Magasanikbacteria bacterium]
MPKMKKVRKGVIVVAGLGTRFLPATKAMPKEMLPVLDKPVVQYIVEEMVASGIKEIIFVTSSQKRAIEDHFDRDRDFEVFLKERGKFDRIKPLVDLTSDVQFFYTRQSEPLGNGHALLCAKDFIGDEPFAFSDGDSIIDAKVPVVKQLVKMFYSKKAPIIGVQRVEDKEFMTTKGNVFVEKAKEDRCYKVKKFVEKPSVKNVSPHGLIIGGMRYIFTKEIWGYLEKQKKGRGGEVWVADAANAMAKKKPFYAYEYKGEYFDTGNKTALLKATLHFAMKDEQIKKDIKPVLEMYC